MDNKTFDALTRGFGTQRNRRDALKAFAAGLLGLGVARDVAAQVSAERASCGQSCRVDGDCNAGLICRESRGDDVCVRRPDGGGSCNRNSDCGNNTDLCRNGRCENTVTCSRCSVSGDCPRGQICRNGSCGECTRDQQCPARERCRNGRCERDRDECRSNSDCPRRRRCRNGRCVRRN